MTKHVPYHTEDVKEDKGVSVAVQQKIAKTFMIGFYFLLQQTRNETLTKITCLECGGYSLIFRQFDVFTMT